MCLPLHPFLVGMPHRVAALAEVLDHIRSHQDVWMATGREIAAWYLEHHYDKAIAHTAKWRAEV